MKNFFTKIVNLWNQIIFYIRRQFFKGFFKKSLKNRECLTMARRSDFTGNYDIDGASFDGRYNHISGFISHTFDKMN
jgi:hypothetical protein